MTRVQGAKYPRDRRESCKTQTGDIRFSGKIIRCSDDGRNNIRKNHARARVSYIDDLRNDIIFAYGDSWHVI